MKDKFAKLIDVKSIVTLLLTLVFCAMALCGAIAADQFVTIFMVIMGFYFGTQSQKKATVPTYTGSEQSEPVTGETVPIYSPSDAMTANEVHPPDGEDEAEY